MKLFKEKVKKDLDETKMLLDKLSFQSIEAYKLLRTNIGFTIEDNNTCKKIGITSSTRGEGKSTLAINLSHVIAQDNQRVLLIEGDLRLPTFAKRLGIKEKYGLSNILGKSVDYGRLVNSLKFKDNFYILTSGPIPPNPSELLGGKKMDKLIKCLEKYFDYIVFDLPPVNIVSDPVAISNKLDGMIMCVRENYVLLREVKEAVSSLQLVGANLLGFVVTDDEANNKKYGYNYRYKKYGYGRYGKYYKYYRYGYYNKYSYSYYRRHTKEIEEADKDNNELKQNDTSSK